MLMVLVGVDDHYDINEHDDCVDVMLMVNMMTMTTVLQW